MFVLLFSLLKNAKPRGYNSQVVAFRANWPPTNDAELTFDKRNDKKVMAERFESLVIRCCIIDNDNINHQAIENIRLHKLFSR